MNTSNCIEQQGIVESIDNSIVSVKILQTSACSSCDSKGLCKLFGTDEKVIEVKDKTGRFHKGERVSVSISRSLGTKAVMLGYFFPFLLVMLTLIVLTAAGIKEWETGVLALSTLIPYFIILRFFREKLSDHFVFTLNKIE